MTPRRARKGPPAAGADVPGRPGEAQPEETWPEGRQGPPRVVALMGSGELSPTMVKVHRSLLERLGPGPVPALLLDTPFGFQENARELQAKVVAYFREHLQTAIEPASLGRPPRGPRSSGQGGARPDPVPGAAAPVEPGPLADDPFAAELLTSKLRGARYVFSGPGSPTYALRRWRPSVVPALLKEKLTRGGAVCFASAAALTLGAFTVPVYEIYKVGEDPHWAEGLDVLGAVGLHVAVVPHYNNNEGGTHDTRFCYLGARRLEVLEAALPADHFVLGVDEHTACVIDLSARSVAVEGLGVVTVRRAGRSTTYPAGSRVDLDQVLEAAYSGPPAAGTAPAGQGPRPGPDAGVDTPTGAGSVTGTGEGGNGPAAARGLATSPLLDSVHEQEEAFAAALGRRDAGSAVAAVLAVEQLLADWSTDIPQEDELERARASLRAMVVELGHLAAEGLRDPREALGPYLELLVRARRLAREGGRYEEADDLRGRLAHLGVELRDHPGGTEWLLRSPKG